MNAITDHRITIRYVAATLAAIIAAIYFLIGFQVVAVIEQVADQAAFAVPAGIAFGFATIALMAFDNRVVWAIGAVLQALIIVMYFAVSGQRTPAFELWGILIRVAQFVLLGALVLLAASPTVHEEEGVVAVS